MLALKNRRFSDRNVSKDCMAKMMRFSLEDFSRLIISEKPGIVEGLDVCKDAEGLSMMV